MNRNQQIAAGAGLVAVILVGLLLLVTRFQTAPPAAIATAPVATPPATASPNASPTASPPATVTSTAPSPAAPSGVLTGALGYPSEFIPPLTVYAISVADQRVFFSVDTPRYPLATNTPPRPSYTMTGVAPGTYYVLAYRNDDVNVEAKNAPGVYSQYVLQCLQPNAAGTTPAPACSSADHSLVPVTVHAGETVPRIDVTDWYNGPARASYPPRPR
jgi:hypothetical protein